MDKMSRRGQLMGESLALFAVTVLAAIILIAFFLIIKSVESPQTSEKLNQLYKQDSAFLSLKAYINAPVEIVQNGENITMKMGDLIELASSNQSYKEIFQKRTHDILDRAFGAGYSIDVTGLIVFPPAASTYAACDSIKLPNDISETLCLK